MSRLRILVSAVPLLVAATVAGAELMPGPQPCIAVGDASVQLIPGPWHADLHVAFTDDPTLATVRVQISDSAAAADFAVVDDVDSPQDSACEATPATRLISITANPAASGAVIYLSKDGPAEYRIFVRSKTFTAREAAALVVGAGDGHRRLATASLGTGL